MRNVNENQSKLHNIIYPINTRTSPDLNYSRASSDFAKFAWSLVSWNTKFGPLKLASCWTRGQDPAVLVYDQSLKHRRISLTQSRKTKESSFRSLLGGGAAGARKNGKDEEERCRRWALGGKGGILIKLKDMWFPPGGPQWNVGLLFLCIRQTIGSKENKLNNVRIFNKNG